jgi:hypothetical protein
MSQPTTPTVHLPTQAMAIRPLVKFGSCYPSIAAELLKAEEAQWHFIRDNQLEKFWKAVREKRDWRLRLEILIAYLEKDLYSPSQAKFWFNNGKIQQFLVSLRYLNSINYLDLNRYIFEIERLVILSEWEV